jgi:uncharacterized protein YjbI with pentapeptide repeats
MTRVSKKDVTKKPPVGDRAVFLRGTNFKMADLKKVVFRGKDLRGYNFFKANLAGAKLAGCNLEGVNLRGAVLRYADLTLADLSGADLREVKFTGAFVDYANFDGADLRGATGLDLMKGEPRNFDKTIRGDIVEYERDTWWGDK